jgi:hypothetical protein
MLVSMQLVPQSSSPIEHDETQLASPGVAIWHSGVAPSQTTPQPPQDPGDDKEDSHPFGTSPSQLANPSSHATPHDPPTHVGAP